MVLWAGIFGALVGWCLTGFETYGVLIGGTFGLIGGWGFARAMRAEIAAATAILQAQIDLLSSAPRLPVMVPAEEPIRPPEPVAVRTPPPVVVAPRSEPIRTEPAAPPAPHALDIAIAAAKGWLFGGNTIVRIGLVILFVGLSFLASYAASAGLFPIEFRLAIVALVGIALLGIGFRTRVERSGFGLALQGAGVATLYLTLFAGAKLYDTVPVSAAFALMILVCVFGCALALLQRSQALAVTAFAGGFAVPLLLGGEGGHALGLFGYYTILNLAILFIAQRQAWRLLNLVGFFATFGVATLWGATSYRPDDFWIAQIFLILSVLIYVATAVLHARATPGRLGGVVDTTLLFGPAIVGFGLQVALVHDMPFGSAFAAVGFAALYLGVAAVAMRYRRDDLRVLNETMLAIAIGFVTLAVPLALGARWTSAAWALEGAGAFWVGMRQARWVPRLFGLALQAVAALVYLAATAPVVSSVPVANPAVVGAVLIAAAALATAWWLRTPLPHSGSKLAATYARAEAVLGSPVFLLGFGFWWLAWAMEAGRSLPIVERNRSFAQVFDADTRSLLRMLAYVASAWGAQAIARAWRWPVAAWPSLVTLVPMVLAFLGMIATEGHVLDTPDWAIWAAAIALHLHMLYRNRESAEAQPIARAAHVGGVWLATAMLADCLWLGIDRGGLWATAWAEVAFLASAVAVLAALTFWTGPTLRGASRRWPLDAHAPDYGWLAAVPVAAMVFFAALGVALFSSGAADPLPYLPIVNPVDLTLGLALAALEAWRRAMIAAVPRSAARDLLRQRGAMAALAGLAFVIVNTIWLRAAHHLLGVAWDADALLASVVVQSGLAILWTSLALALMVVAHRRARRTLWLVGAGLLGLTVAKLLLVDLNATGGGARIVAFIVVGALMLVVGYLAPLPPRHGEVAT